MSAEPTKTCPFCSETIHAEAIKCPYCGSMLAPVQQFAPQNRGYQMPPYLQPMPPYQQPMPPYPQYQQPISAQTNNDVPHPVQLHYPPSSYHAAKFTTPYIISALCLMIGFFPAIIGFFIWQEFDGSYYYETEAFFGRCLFLFGFPILIVGSINFLILLYRCWMVIQDGYAQTTPGVAVGGLFIPFLNIIWMFIALGCLGIDLNRYIGRHKMAIKPCNNILVILYLLLWFIIPFVSFFFAILIAPFALHTIMRTARDIQQVQIQQRYNQEETKANA